VLSSSDVAVAVASVAFGCSGPGRVSDDLHCIMLPNVALGQGESGVVLGRGGPGTMYGSVTVGRRIDFRGTVGMVSSTPRFRARHSTHSTLDVSTWSCRTLWLCSSLNIAKRSPWVSEAYNQK
jgi:hypothetical protein